MKHFVVFLISLVILIIALSNTHMFLKTRNGAPFECFKTETSEALPPILSGYLLNTNIRYHLYKMPNYVIDLLTYDKNFSIIYKSGPKFTIIVFPSKLEVADSANFQVFYDKLKDLHKQYSSSFNLIVRDESVAPVFNQQYDRVAYKDLREHCSVFCLINPQNNLMFGFKRITNTETEALEAVFQQFNDLIKK